MIVAITIMMVVLVTDVFVSSGATAWLHSARPAEGAEVPVDSVETGSVSSSGSFADQGYAASEGTAEDPCPLGSPSDLTPRHAQRDISSDSDEGCATWNSRSSGDLHQKGQSGKIKNSYEEDPKLMAQLQMTLADLDAELAEMNQSSETPSEADDVIPVSVVDLVPVTTIDEVLDVHLSPGGDRMREPVNNDAQWTSITQNKNNSATSCPEPAVQPRVSAEQRGTRTTQEVKQSASKEKKSQPEAPLRVNEVRGSASGTKPAAAVPPSAKSTSVVVPPNPQPADGGRSRASPKAQEVLAPRREGTKITQMPESRFGTKTFTIVPTKASMPSAPQTQASHTIGAIKIDEQGNMVKGGGSRHHTGLPAEREEVVAGPLQAKAKFFWTSTDKQETQTTTKTTTAAAAAAPQKAREPESPPELAPAGAVIKPAQRHQPETDSSSSVSVTNHSSTAKDGSHYSQVSEPAGQAQRATLNPQDPRDLSFLKQQRRTSSQYMATALTYKYTARPAARADAIQEKPPAPAQKPSVEIRSATTTIITSSTNKGSKTSTQTAVPKENGSVSSWTALQSPLAYKSHTFPKQTTVEPPRPLQGGTGTTSRVDSGVVNSKTKLTTQMHTNRCNTTHNPTSAQPDQNPEPWASPGVLPEPNQVNIFGPVKKFRPVIQKSVDKDTSLHTSLMEAIQSGDSKDRLRKVSELSAGSGLRKPTLVEDENSHSALLSAIRANSSSRLNKTRSEAARELDRFRVKESESGSQKQTSAPPHTSPPSAPAPVAAALPPPPPPPTMAPRPPRALLVTAGNPEESRDALLEAIRSGAGAQGLKKVPVATKTVQVNGRLGTIQASCSLSQGV